MKESTGSISAIYVIIFFVVIMFGFIMSVLSYYKGYKISNAITAAIDDAGGYNSVSKETIDKRLISLGYNRNQKKNCNKYDTSIIVDNNGKTVKSSINSSGYCVYIIDEGNDFYSYKVGTYLTLDFGLINFKLPYEIVTSTSTIYDWSKSGLNKDND